MIVLLIELVTFSKDLLFLYYDSVLEYLDRARTYTLIFSAFTSRPSSSLAPYGTCVATQ
jgi:hypothetical protein